MGITVVVLAATFAFVFAAGYWIGVDLERMERRERDELDERARRRTERPEVD